jgi:hypothetical protein
MESELPRHDQLTFSHSLVISGWEHRKEPVRSRSEWRITAEMSCLVMLFQPVTSTYLPTRVETS